MRTILNINKDWAFFKDTGQIPSSCDAAEKVDQGLAPRGAVHSYLWQAVVCGSDSEAEQTAQ